MKSLIVGMLVVFCSYGFVSAEGVDVSSPAVKGVDVSSSAMKSVDVSSPAVKGVDVSSAVKGVGISSSVMKSMDASSLTTKNISVFYSTSVWATYKKEFFMVGRGLFAAPISGRVFDNKYIVAVRVVFGMVTEYHDDFENPTVIVSEFSILGNERVMRYLQKTDDPKLAIWQVRKGDEWIDTCLETGIEIRPTNPKRFLKKGKIKSVLIKTRSLDSGLLLVFELQNEL